MLDTDAFLDDYPEFDAHPDAGLVGRVLAQQALLVGDTWGSREDIYHGLITAEILAASPYGRENRLIDKTGKTPWTERIRQMRAANAFARNRIG